MQTTTTNENAARGAGCNCDDKGKGQYHLPNCSEGLYVEPKIRPNDYLTQAIESLTNAIDGLIIAHSLIHAEATKLSVAPRHLLDQTIGRKLAGLSTISLQQKIITLRTKVAHLEQDLREPTLKVEIERREVEANGWVEAGSYWTAMFRNQPVAIKGCPCGRSQVNAEAAIWDLIRRTNAESNTSFTRRDIEVI